MERSALDAIVEAAPLDEPVFGGWCERCALPSMVTQLFEVTVDGELHELFRAEVCEQCG